MILKNATCLTLSPPSIEAGDIRINGNTIVECSSNLIPIEREEVVDIKGKFVLPGFVNAHTHLYSSLVRGMPPLKERPQNFLQVLQMLWWKLDRALDDDAIYYSALAGAIEAALCGTTTLVDHHASPKAIHGSLDIIKTALEEIGLRGVLCYETTDRGGKKERDQGVKENERFIRNNKHNELFRGMVGAHASFTLSDESLFLCGEVAKKYNTGVHIHVAEDLYDVADAEEDYRCSVTDRLKKHGILKKESILAHCIHLQQREFSTLRDENVWLVHNPRSNMNNNVGHAPINLFGDRRALGTDGFPADMFEETRTGYFKMQEAAYGLSIEQTAHLVQGGQRMISEIFRKEFGTLRNGSIADLIVLDYCPPTPLTAENLAGHFLSGMRSSMVESVMVNGTWIVNNRSVVGIDMSSVFSSAARVASKLWKRLDQMK